MSGAVTTMLANFFGTDEMTFSMTSNTPQVIQKTRTYTRFSDAAADVVDARVYLGIHFRFADIVARQTGIARGQLGLQPLPAARRSELKVEFSNQASH